MDFYALLVIFRVCVFLGLIFRVLLDFLRIFDSVGILLVKYNVLIFNVF